MTPKRASRSGGPPGEAARTSATPSIMNVKNESASSDPHLEDGCRPSGIDPVEEECHRECVRLDRGLGSRAQEQLRQLLIALNGSTFVREYRKQTGQPGVIAEVADVHRASPIR
jgi:hypothetical protein